MTIVVVDEIVGHPGRDALVVEGPTVREIGRSERLVTSGVEVERIAGIAIPGLRDAHTHPLGLAAARSRLDVSDALTIAGVGSALGRRLEDLDAAALVATGLDDERIEERRMPTRQELDSFTGDRPVLVYRHCSHIAAANSAALSLAGVGPRTPDPPGGRFARTPGGDPDGVLEETAVGPVAAALAPLLPTIDTSALLSAMTLLAGRGLVGIHAMAATGGSPWCSGADEVEALIALGDESPLDVDVFVITDDVAELAEAAERIRNGSRRLRFAGWKGFADGSLGGHTALMRTPYHDRAGRGIRRGRAEDLSAMAGAAVDLGGVAAIHAIGDEGVETALTIGEQLGSGSVRIEHASIADPAQVERMARAGVTASVQPSFATSDRPWLEDRLGPERIAWAYAFRTMLGSGVHVIGGSDAPIEPADPFVGIADAMRPRPESLGWQDALDLYAADEIRTGGDATFVVIDRHPARVRPDAVAETRVVARWHRGIRTP